MTRAKRLLAIPLCLLAALAVGGFGATSAFAEGNWLIEGTPISESVPFEGENDGTEFAFLLPGLNFQLVFKKITYDEASLLKGGESSEVFLFTEGAVYTISPKVLQKNCTPGDLTFDVKGKLFLHNNKTYERLEALPGKPLTITTYPPTCILGEENQVTGTLVLEDSTGSFSSLATSHLVRQAPAALFPNQMKFGENNMNLDGSWTLKLKGKEGGKAWSGVA
jgi:hypothetical protein